METDNAERTSDGTLFMIEKNQNKKYDDCDYIYRKNHSELICRLISPPRIDFCDQNK